MEGDGVGGGKAKNKTNLFGMDMSTTRCSKACRNGVAVDAVDVCRAIRSTMPSRSTQDCANGQVRTMLPNLFRNSAATLSQKARSSEPGGWNWMVGGPLEDIHSLGRGDTTEAHMR